MKRTDDKTLIAALRALARDIRSADGVANAAISEAADRMEDLLGALNRLTRESIAVMDNVRPGAAFRAAVCRAELVLARKSPKP